MRHNNLKDFTSETAREAGKKSKRGISLKKALKNVLREELEKAKEGNDKALTPELVIKSWLVTSMKNPAMAKVIIDLSGELKKKIEHTGKGGGPIRVKNNDFKYMTNAELLKIANAKIDR